MYFLQAYGVYIYVCVYLCPHILANRSSLHKNGAWSVCLWDLLVEDSGYNCLHLRAMTGTHQSTDDPDFFGKKTVND